MFFLPKYNYQGFVKVILSTSDITEYIAGVEDYESELWVLR